LLLCSCFTGCSCDSDCSINGDCCYPKTLALNSSDKRSVFGFQIQQSCLYPTFPEPKEDEKHLYQSFLMISSVGEEHLGSTNEILNTSCGDTHVAPWGSLYPVHSAKSKQIYKNIQCAKANEVTDEIWWDAIINCYADDVVDAIIGLEENTSPENCEISFHYPGDIGDLKRSKCYSSLIGTCPESLEFQMPEGTSLSRNDIVSLCTSGLMSPYTAIKMYANVFCHICNDERFDKFLLCRKISDGGLKGVKSKGFTALIDSDFIDKLNDNNIVKEEVLPRACSLDDGVSLFFQTVT
jgi:hypothetical protein